MKGKVASRTVKGKLQKDAARLSGMTAPGVPCCSNPSSLEAFLPSREGRPSGRPLQRRFFHSSG